MIRLIQLKFRKYIGTHAVYELSFFDETGAVRVLHDFTRIGWGMRKDSYEYLVERLGECETFDDVLILDHKSIINKDGD